MNLRLSAFVCLCSLLCTSVYADGMPVESSGSKNIEVREAKRPSLSDKDLLAYQYCGKDSDCMPVINGCCQCMQGDKFVAINKDRLVAFQERFSCEKILCPKTEVASYSCEDGVVSCVNSRCMYLEPTE